MTDRRPTHAALFDRYFTLLIQTNTVDAEIERLSRFVLLRSYFAGKREELREYNARFADDPSAIVNARRLTNVGTLRAYIIAYLRSHPKIHQELTFLVRQLAPTPEGLPIEIYVFTNDTRWADRVIAPSSHIDKVYEVRLDRAISDVDLAAAAAARSTATRSRRSSVRAGGRRA